MPKESTALASDASRHMCLGPESFRVMVEEESGESYRRQLGERIRQAREAAGYSTAADFFRATGLPDANAYYRYERGAVEPKPQVLAVIAQAAGVSMEWLVLGEAAAPPAFTEWLSTPVGRTVTDEARRFLAALPVQGQEPIPLFYDLALMAYTRGLRSSEAVEAARETTERLKGE